MRLVIQRVQHAKVEVSNEIVGSIGRGLLVFLGIGHDDRQEIADAYIKKILELRIFEDDNERMNLSVKDISAEFLIVSQFTLYGDCSKGRRPSFDKAAKPQMAETLYEYFITSLRSSGAKVEAGRFGADMKVSLLNDGPVTFILGE